MWERTGCVLEDITTTTIGGGATWRTWADVAAGIGFVESTREWKGTPTIGLLCIPWELGHSLATLYQGKEAVAHLCAPSSIASMSWNEFFFWRFMIFTFCNEVEVFNSKSLTHDHIKGLYHLDELIFYFSSVFWNRGNIATGHDIWNMSMLLGGKCFVIFCGKFHGCSDFWAGARFGPVLTWLMLRSMRVSGVLVRGAPTPRERGSPSWHSPRSPWANPPHAQSGKISVHWNGASCRWRATAYRTMSHCLIVWVPRAILSRTAVVCGSWTYSSLNNFIVSNPKGLIAIFFSEISTTYTHRWAINFLLEKTWREKGKWLMGHPGIQKFRLNWYSERFFFFTSSSRVVKKNLLYLEWTLWLEFTSNGQKYCCFFVDFKDCGL